MSVTIGDRRRQIAAALNLKAIVDFATGSHRRAVQWAGRGAARLPARILRHPAA
jgi:hypothetical protein